MLLCYTVHAVLPCDVLGAFDVCLHDVITMHVYVMRMLSARGLAVSIAPLSNSTPCTSCVASVPGLPRSVRVLIMRRRQTFENWGRPGLKYHVG